MDGRFLQALDRTRPCKARKVQAAGALPDTTFMALGSRVPRHGSSPLLDRLPPWLARRLGVLAGPVPEDPAQDRPLIARSLAFLFLVGASLSVVWLLAPHSPESDDRIVLGMTVAAYATGIVLFAGYDRLPMSALKAAVVAATIVITGAVYANHENGSTYVVYYFWATVYAFAFFSLGQAIFQTALVGIAFGSVLYLQSDIWQAEIARWLLVIATTAAAGLLVRFLTGALRHRSLHDPLTGLPNRRLYLASLDEALERTAQDGRQIAVLFLDLDGFKYVNDSLGHHVGDALLVAVAQRLSGALRPGDMTARFGGDEFALLCCGRRRRARGAGDRRARQRRAGRRRSGSSATSCTSRRASASHSPTGPTTATRCCATPMPRCTPPSSAAAPAASSSGSRTARR